MDDYRIDIDDDENEKVPEVKQNEVSEKKAIGVAIGVFVWIFIFAMLKFAGVIPAYVMRICIYPVVVGLILYYIFIKYNNRGF